MLQAMGLRLYLPRYRLPGAAPSRVIPWGISAPVESGMPQATAPVETSAHAAPSIATGASAVNPSSAESSARIAPVTPSVAAKPSAATVTPTVTSKVASEPTARFQALLLPVAAPLAVLALVPTVARLHLPERERKLLQAILHWLGVVEAATQAPRPFQWPLPGLPDASAAQAGASLDAFLDQARRELAFTHLLIFGEPLQAALGPAATDQGMVATYSLQQLTTVPALKRECWLTLQPLQRALADGRP